MARPAILTLLLTLGACGGGDRTVASGSVEDGAGNRAAYAVRRSSDGATTTVRSADGTAVIRTGDAAAAAAFPPGLALYPGAQMTSNMAVAATGKDGGSVAAFESADAPDRIVAFYRTAAERAGYTVESAIEAGTMSMIAGKRAGDAHAFTLTVNRAGDRSEATLIGGS